MLTADEVLFKFMKGYPGSPIVKREHVLAAMIEYATLACEEQRKECSRCLECDIPKGPTHNLVLYAPLPTLK